MNNNFLTDVLITTIYKGRYERRFHTPGFEAFKSTAGWSRSAQDCRLWNEPIDASRRPGIQFHSPKQIVPCPRIALWSKRVWWRCCWYVVSRMHFRRTPRSAINLRNVFGASMQGAEQYPDNFAVMLNRHRLDRNNPENVDAVCCLMPWVGASVCFSKLRQWFWFNTQIKPFWDVLIIYILSCMMRVHYFQVDLTDISAKTESLGCVAHHICCWESGFVFVQFIAPLKAHLGQPLQSAFGLHCCCSAGRAQLFDEEGEIPQLHAIMSVLGTYRPDSWGAAAKLPDFGKIAFPEYEAQSLARLLPHATAAAVSLLQQLLKWAL